MTLASHLTLHLISGAVLSDADRLARRLRHSVVMIPADEGGPGYHEAFPSLASVVLEDSWVLSVHASLTELTFVLDLVLAPTHPGYTTPLSGRVRCYRRATVVVHSDSAVLLRRSTLRPAVDAAGERDYGHIDTFGPVSGVGDGIWELTGDWGDAVVHEPRITVQLSETTGS